MTSNDSLNTHLSFNGEGNSYRKEKMTIFIEGVNCDIWDAVKMVHLFPFIKLIM